MPPVHLNNIMRGTSRTVLGEDMPLVEPNPSYKAWGYLVCNELAQGVGRQMYYTDEIGDSNRCHIFQALIVEHMQACCIFSSMHSSCCDVVTGNIRRVPENAHLSCS